MSETTNNLLYNAESSPAKSIVFFNMLQHVAAALPGILAAPLLIATALNLDVVNTSYLLTMALLMAAFATFMQSRAFGGLGAGFLCIDAVGFNAVGVIIAGSLMLQQQGLSDGLDIVAANRLALSTIFGCSMAGACVMFLLSWFVKYAKVVVTPLVSSIVVIMIGLSLIRVGVVSSGGGFSAMANGSFGSLDNLLLAGVVLLIIIISNLFKSPYIRMGALSFGFIGGIAWAMIKGQMSTDFSDVPLFAMAKPFEFGLGFDAGIFFQLVIIYIVTAIGNIGNISVYSSIIGESIGTPPFIKRVSGAIAADGVASFVSACFNSFPTLVFAQNIGVIKMTGVASKKVGYYAACFFLLAAFIYPISYFFSLIPEPILGGLTLMLFASIAMSGMQMLGSVKFTTKNSLIFSISLSLGLAVEFEPQILTFFPDLLQRILSSGITVGGLTAMLLNLILRAYKQEDHAA